MNISKALTLLSALTVSGAMHLTAPAMAYEAFSTKSSLSTTNISEPMQLAQARIYYPPARVYYPPARIYRPPARVYYSPARIYRPPARVYYPPARVYYPPTRVYRSPGIHIRF